MAVPTLELVPVLVAALTSALVLASAAVLTPALEQVLVSVAAPTHLLREVTIRVTTTASAPLSVSQNIVSLDPRIG